jgi:Tfp pilus assembly protein FimT
MAKKRKAYSLIEAIIVVAIIGALAFIAVPRLNFAGMYKKQAHSIAKQITTDLRRTRTMAIVYAATNTTGYSLRMTGSSPYTGYQIVNDANSVVIDTLTIDSHISSSGGANFRFGPLGNLRAGSDSSLTVTSQGQTYTITLISGTGIVECSGG